ncbi:hypothetical protein N0V93_003533 [Gnomoniopsis smithogilvyi]|uniref:DUF6594 domain-containing protein n=1 Tax=Gnomoniopsis smithogilvyi TaxID=1191159 RepID=A0A9W9CZ81_9PEZI|nr:hypothetical protein N0V93_003533 [Gnomoniopsis smithogilvyi]
MSILPVATAQPRSNTCAAVEDFPEGYPRYSALISSHQSFQVFRRYLRLRTRLLLHKQDELAVLEGKLDEIDRQETKPLFLGNLRRDTNGDRQRLMQQIDTALKEYDTLLERHEKMVVRSPGKSRDITSLKNWTENTACIARDETAYLSCKEDLLSLGDNSMDPFNSILEGPIEDTIIWTKKQTGIGPKNRISEDSDVHIFSRELITGFARFTIATVLILLLFAPMLLLLSVESTMKQLSISFASCVIFIAIVSSLFRTKAVEVLMAAATYAAVLVVFLTNNNPRT